MTHWIIGLWSNRTFEVGSLLSQQPTQILPSDSLNCHLSIWKIYTARWHQGKELDLSPMYCNYTETKIVIVKTSIFTINAINLKITCHGHPTNKAKNLTMTYLYPIQNCFQLFLIPPPHPPKNAHYLPVLLQVNFQMLKLAFPVSTSSSLSPLSTFTHWVLLLSYQWATKVIYTRLTFCLGQFTEGFHRPNVTQSNPTSDWASVHCLQNWCEQMIPHSTPRYFLVEGFKNL